MYLLIVWIDNFLKKVIEIIKKVNKGKLVLIHNFLKFKILLKGVVIFKQIKVIMRRMLALQVCLLISLFQ